MEPAKRYDIRDAARYLDVAPSTLRYWESEGLVRTERNPENDYRQYSLHSLIDASEIAFYRKLGVSVKELKGYHDLTIEALDDTLERTATDLARRIAELDSMKLQLEKQQELNAIAKDLAEHGARFSAPAVTQLRALDYRMPEIWQLLVSEPWRYGILVEAAHPETIVEALADTDLPDASPLWKKTPDTAHRPCLECLLRVSLDASESTASSLFEEARRQGIRPSRLVGSYLLSATEPSDDQRYDYYRAWFIGESCT